MKYKSVTEHVFDVVCVNERFALLSRKLWAHHLSTCAGVQKDFWSIVASPPCRGRFPWFSFRSGAPGREHVWTKVFNAARLAETSSSNSRKKCTSFTNLSERDLSAESTTTDEGYASGSKKAFSIKISGIFTNLKLPKVSEEFQV